MNKKQFILITILLFSLIHRGLAHSGAAGIIGGGGSWLGPHLKGAIRPCAGLGYTGIDMDTGKGNSFNYRCGAQLLFTHGVQIINFGYGLDIGYIHTYSVFTETEKYRSDHIHNLAVLEGTFFYFTLQIGAGAYFGVGDRNRTDAGSMIALGASLPVFEKISIPFLVRTDIIFAHRVTFAVSFSSGATFFF